MKFFNAKFEPTAVEPLSENNKFNVTGNVIDNTGMFTAADVKVNDIVYLNGSYMGELLLRYKVLEITRAVGTELVAKMQWDMVEEPIAPQESAEGIIGQRINNSELSMITNVNTNATDELLVSAARSYEQSLMTAQAKAIESKIKIPTIGYSEIV